jgi:hypothetical protein
MSDNPTGSTHTQQKTDDVHGCAKAFRIGSIDCNRFTSEK